MRTSLLVALVGGLLLIPALSLQAQEPTILVTVAPVEGTYTAFDAVNNEVVVPGNSLDYQILAELVDPAGSFGIAGLALNLRTNAGMEQPPAVLDPAVWNALIPPQGGHPGAGPGEQDDLVGIGGAIQTLLPSPAPPIGLGIGGPVVFAQGTVTWDEARALDADPVELSVDMVGGRATVLLAETYPYRVGDAVVTFGAPLTVVPEPATMLLLLGGAGLLVSRRRRG